MTDTPPPSPDSPDFTIAPAWINTAGRTRTWALKDPHGTQMAEITTKAAAIKLARLLSEVIPQQGR